MSKIKTIASRILPSPANTFHTKIQELKDEIRAENNPFLLWNDNASDLYKKAHSFKQYWEQNNFREEYFRLISGMGLTCREEIGRIHSRLEMLLETQGYIDFFTSKEKQRIRHQQEWYKNNVFRIDDACFGFGGFLLPIRASFMMAVLYLDNYGLDSLCNMEAIRQKSIIDAGAYIGDSLICLSKITNESVFCFEPMKANYEKLCSTIELNNISNAVPVQVALGNKAGTTQFIYDTSGSMQAPPGLIKITIKKL